ncbi:DUF1028 domain-containing protein [Candidatus Bathyarchaeota archaeon]|nr:DUF1028 domain-containing protein [Candidatus Bathyarchaeota archaeon]
MSVNRKSSQLLGICGVYCGACSTYRAYNDNDEAILEWETRMGMPPDQVYCKGCGSNLVNEWCGNCKFRKCTKDKEVTYCFECDDFPCQMLIDFSRTRPHRSLGLRNLKKLKSGTDIQELLKQQEKRWACSQCGKKLHWYSEKCPTCGKSFLNATQEAASLSRVSLTTFSITACCQQTGELGIAVSTAIPAMGSINPFAKAHVGAIATQAWSNPYLGIDGLNLLEKGLSPVEVLKQLLKVDVNRERRQISIVDAHGNVAAFTGKEVEPISGHHEGKGYVVAGNLLVNHETIQTMAEAFESASGSPGERLLFTLEAGQAIGGDRRGKVSAALLIVKDEEYPYIDLRVDEHKQPVAELRRIFNVYKVLPYLDDLHPKRTWPRV